MKSLLVKLGVILLGLLIIGNTEVWGADWKIYCSNDMYLGYYDTQSITRPSKNVIRVWVRWDYTEKGVMYYMGKFGIKYMSLSHSINLPEINCLEKTIRSLSLTYYDNEGEVIYSFSSPSSKWDFILPETIGEILYKEVCK
jgi:hypothetical protein